MAMAYIQPSKLYTEDEAFLIAKKYGLEEDVLFDMYHNDMLPNDVLEKYNLIEADESNLYNNS